MQRNMLQHYFSSCRKNTPKTSTEPKTVQGKKSTSLHVCPQSKFIGIWTYFAVSSLLPLIQSFNIQLIRNSVKVFWFTARATLLRILARV